MLAQQQSRAAPGNNSVEALVKFFLGGIQPNSPVSDQNSQLDLGKFGFTYLLHQSFQTIIRRYGQNTNFLLIHKNTSMFQIETILKE